jgi:hypothetical protein
VIGGANAATRNGDVNNNVLTGGAAAAPNGNSGDALNSGA